MQFFIEHMLSNPETCESDGVADQLRAEYVRGSPVDSLRILLRHEDDRIAGEAAWIASELSRDGKPLLGDAVKLLRHRSKKVRFWALDCVLSWADSCNGCELLSALALLEDIEEAVRWKAKFFLASARKEQLRAAFESSPATDSESAWHAELEWLLGEEGSDATAIIAALGGPDRRRRSTAAVAAARMAKRDRSALAFALSGEDSEISQFAQDILELINIEIGSP